MQGRLSERQQQVLWATVNYYIATAEPVGSKALAQEYALQISPATIRNVMGVLEKAGLLYQPHTSAGRVPSDSGYRLYVDELIQPSDQLAQWAERTVSKRLRPQIMGFEALLRHAAQILATLSGCLALITLPQSPTTRIRHLHLLQVEPRRVMLILVTDTYETQSLVMDLPDTIALPADPEMMDRELQILSNCLNHHLQGRSLSHLAVLDGQELDREFQRYADFLNTLLTDLSQRVLQSRAPQMLVGGLAEFLRHPEFAELHQAQTIIHLIEEEQAQLWPLIFELPAPDHPTDNAAEGRRVSICIGAENPLAPIQICTLVSSTYHQGMTPVGSVGVLGPTRMAYEKVIAVVEATADYLSDCLSQNG